MCRALLILTNLDHAALTVFCGLLVAAALMAGGKAGGLEPFTVLVVSVFASKLLYSHVFPDRVDDVQVRTIVPLAARINQHGIRAAFCCVS